MPLSWTVNDGEVFAIMYRILYKTEKTKCNNNFEAGPSIFLLFLL